MQTASDVASDVKTQGSFVQALGPGILMAAAAVGGSHLVASTKAGAQFGWSLLIVMLVVNVFKYPFFLYGARYTAATGETILHGYPRLGKGYLLAFFLLNLVNTVFNIAGGVLYFCKFGNEFWVVRELESQSACGADLKWVCGNYYFWSLSSVG
ncbi:hypothetical protein P3T73_14505 [Kiritimatiellota bacterium B12222]|nr:hypothetical protein P3T73_14505 [Kiritimatiellota bacterium B12222]